MSYATLQQLTDRYGARALVALTDRGEIPTDAIDGTVVDRALADAAALIDGYLAARYRLPVAQVPPLLTDLTLSIAWYKLHPHTPDQKAKDEHDQALRTLRDIAAGVVRLAIAGAEPATTGGGGARLTDRERPFTAETMRGFI
jgi:phage gp36-like protein